MAFERTPTLSTFNIPAENPLSDGGKWGGYSTRPPLMASGTGTAHGTVEFVVNGSFYKPQAFFGSILEAFGCTPQSGLGAALESQRVAFWLNNPNDLIGYAALWGGGIGEQFTLRRYYGGGNFIDIGVSSGAWPEKLGLRITPTHVEVWGFYTGIWSMKIQVADTTYRGVFWAALETEEQGGIAEVAFSCFGASVPNRTQIYRVIKADALIGTRINRSTMGVPIV